MAKVDMHCHSAYSDRPAHWIFYKVGAKESYISPDELYRRLKLRGMDFITVTDHDVIGGALELAEKHDDAFVSCEFTVSFAGELAETHICAYDITEEQYRTAMRLRRDVREFAAYLREEGVLAVVPHPFHNNRTQLKVRHLEQLVLLFEHFEEHCGLQLPEVNALQKQFLDRLSAEMIEDLSLKHGIEPKFEEPWKKGRLFGSDDHSGFFLGSAWTEVEGAQTYKDFIAGVREKRTKGQGQSTTALTFAHCALSTVAETLRHKYGGGEIHPGTAPALEEIAESPGLADQLTGLSPKADQASDTPRETLLAECLSDTIMRDWTDVDLLFKRIPGRDLQTETFTFVNALFNSLVRRGLTQVVDAIRGRRVTEAFTQLSFLFPSACLAVPYLLGFKHVHVDKRFCRDLSRNFNLSNPDRLRPERWAWFSDTVLDINGVARTIQKVTAFAREGDVPITAITSVPAERQLDGSVRNFPPIYEFRLPEYESMAISVPPILEMLRYCEEQRFSRIVISTPGPVGLVALWIAKILDIPTAGIYHTDLPRYARMLTRDPSTEQAAWGLVRLLYGKTDAVYVLTNAYRELLIDNGLDPQRIRVFPKGTDVDLFHPERRDGRIWQRWNLNGKTKILYVGRVSREKDLDILQEAYQRLRHKHDGVELVIVGDGPYLEELRQKCADDANIAFTGFVEGDDLARLYASADIFAFPSTTDTYGSAVLEAQASGLPAVVTDWGGPKEVIKDGVTGIVARGNDVESFHEALYRLVSDKRLRQRMGVAARRRAETKSWEEALRLFWENGGRPTPNARTA
jgi:glycosyltransferase involved in cell wall biosynthesis